MSTHFLRVRDDLRSRPARWLVTGAAGLVGAALVEILLDLDQSVVGLDDFSTGQRVALDRVRRRVGPARWLRFSLIEGDVRDASTCGAAVAGVHRVLHQAARGGVTESVAAPRETHTTNVDGFVNVALAAAQAGVDAFVYASSASVYGSDAALPHHEAQITRPGSPYAASKCMGEQYARGLTASMGLATVGLRYFNVVGAGEPEATSRVVPQWLHCLRRGRRPLIFGDGAQTRDFVSVDDVVQANLLAAHAAAHVAGEVFNVGRGEATTLRDLFEVLQGGMARRGAPCRGVTPRHASRRAGDLEHSVADLHRIRSALGYEPTVSVHQMLDRAMESATTSPMTPELAPLG